MRIDAYMQVNQVYNSSKIKKTEKGAASSASDSLEISEFGKEYNIAKQALKEGSDVREDKVQMYREQIKSGAYQVPISDIADCLAGKLLG